MGVKGATIGYYPLGGMQKYVWSHNGLEAKNAQLPAVQRIGVKTKDWSTQSTSSSAPPSPPGMASATVRPWKDGCFSRCRLPQVP